MERGAEQWAVASLPAFRCRHLAQGGGTRAWETQQVERFTSRRAESGDASGLLISGLNDGSFGESLCLKVVGEVPLGMMLQVPLEEGLQVLWLCPAGLWRQFTFLPHLEDWGVEKTYRWCWGASWWVHLPMFSQGQESSG